MPYRLAPWALLLLAPIIAVAFWPAYFGHLGTASFAFHAHGLSASAWLALVGLQSATARSADRGLHRRLGLALFACVPLFAAGAVLVVHSMATKFALKSDPFYGVLGARLGLHDIVSTVVLVGLVSTALRRRRQIVAHAACMLATVLLVLPPVVARLPIPRFFHSGELIVIALAGLALWREPRGRGPFLLVIAVQVLQIALFETFGASALWGRAFAGFSQWPVAPFACAAPVAALLVLVLAWRRPQGRARSPAPPPSPRPLTEAV